jgi:hypothetical protein
MTRYPTKPLTDDVNTPFVRPGLLSWVVAPPPRTATANAEPDNATAEVVPDPSRDDTLEA